MSGEPTTEVRLAATVLGGRVGAAAGVQVPYLVLDLGRGCQLVAAGLLDGDQVRAELLAAALEAGQPEIKARATITSGLAGGAAKPRRRADGAA